MLHVNQLNGFGAAQQDALTLSFLASATSTGSTITVPATVQAGDLLLYFDRARNGAITPPTSVTPTGFTLIGTSITASFTRVNLSYKIAVGTEASTNITGMNGNSQNNKIMLVFRGSSPLVSVTPASVAEEATTGDPSAQVVTASGGTPPLIVVAQYATEANPVDPRTFSPAEDAEIANGTTHYAKYKIYNTAPADVTVDKDDDGTNFLRSCYLQCAA